LPFDGGGGDDDCEEGIRDDNRKHCWRRRRPRERWSAARPCPAGRRGVRSLFVVCDRDGARGPRFRGTPLAADSTPPPPPRMNVRDYAHGFTRVMCEFLFILFIYFFFIFSSFPARYFHSLSFVRILIRCAQDDDDDGNNNISIILYPYSWSCAESKIEKQKRQRPTYPVLSPNILSCVRKIRVFRLHRAIGRFLRQIQSANFFLLSHSIIKSRYYFIFCRSGGDRVETKNINKTFDLTNPRVSPSYTGMQNWKIASEVHILR